MPFELAPHPRARKAAMSGRRLPLTSADLSGLKIRQNAGRSFPKRCVACGKAAAGAMPCCSVCKLVHYCSRECQSMHWSAGHKAACKEAKKWLSLGLLNHNRAAVMYVYNWMGNDEFFELQRQTQKAIVDEIVGGVHGLAVPVNLSVTLQTYPPRTFAAVQMEAPTNSSSKPRCAHTLLGNMAMYPCFSFAPVGMPGAPLRDEDNAMLLAMLQMACRLVTSAIATCISKSRMRVVPGPFICCGGIASDLFWRKAVCRITLNTPIETMRNRTWYFKPDIQLVCGYALVRACDRVFGIEMASATITRIEAMNNQLHTTAPSEYLSREAWRKNILQTMDRQGVKADIDAHCASKAKKDKLRGGWQQVKKEFLEAALAFTDVVRKHLIEYTANMAGGSIVPTTLAQHLRVSEAEMTRVKEELAALDPQYPPDIQRLINRPHTQGHCEEVEGALVTLADGRKESELSITFKTQLEDYSGTDGSGGAAISFPFP
ncbi:unnamed protein product [Vitrella brassicaformis CCMP3155]|uniref:MYND-type domain-containing protein n=2 Tax=Vitrella brassicaformis TaxID=1169539 RepID=A0A0G4GK15_VITBC|nr:unnamed protein product [Vitrella brassicaformis CCMP3155]|eukprot:CEM30250.1 unnamed protein product [Vitrella brassicaformis CCMP3155]